MVMPVCDWKKLGRTVPCPFYESPRSSGRNFIRNFAYDRLAPKVPPGPSAYPAYPKVTYSKGSGPHIPVALDPSSQPRDSPWTCDADWGVLAHRDVVPWLSGDEAVTRRRAVE